MEGRGTVLKDTGNEDSKIQDDSSQTASFSEKRRMLVSSLAVTGFAVSIPVLMLTLLTVNIAETFHVSVGVAAQLSTVSSTTQVIFALLMGVFAVRFKHKSLLLLIGTFFIVVSTIISFFAPTLALMQIVFALVGGGSVIVNIMSPTLIGELLPSQKKAKAVSYFFAITSFASLVGNPILVS
jgi:MFS transporter, DHA1 family, purine base/nucleoside efflux pump